MLPEYHTREFRLTNTVKNLSSPLSVEKKMRRRTMSFTTHSTCKLHRQQNTRASRNTRMRKRTSMMRDVHVRTIDRIPGAGNKIISERRLDCMFGTSGG